MATYGTIPATSTPFSSSSGVPVNLKSHSNDQIISGLSCVRPPPWKEMINLQSLDFPSSLADSISRVKTNTAYFRLNYAIILILIMFLSSFWIPGPWARLFVACMGLCFYNYYRLRGNEPLVIFNYTINDLVILIVLPVVTIGGMFLTGAAAWNVWAAYLIGVVMVLVHAAVRKTEDLFVDEEAFC